MQHVQHPSWTRTLYITRQADIVRLVPDSHSCGGVVLWCALPCLALFCFVVGCAVPCRATLPWLWLWLWVWLWLWLCCVVLCCAVMWCAALFVYPFERDHEWQVIESMFIKTQSPPLCKLWAASYFRWIFRVRQLIFYTFDIQNLLRLIYITRIDDYP